MHERFLLHFGIKLMKVADHSERKKKNEQDIPMQQAETDIMTERREKFCFCDEL